MLIPQFIAAFIARIAYLENLLVSLGIPTNFRHVGDVFFPHRMQAATKH